MHIQLLPAIAQTRLTFLSCFVAIVISLLVLKPDIQKDVKESLSKLYVKREVDFIEAFIIGLFMSTSFFIAHYIGMENPYWVPISCLAVMQGVNTKHIWRRDFYRIVGTALGMVLCWLILSFFKTPITIILAIMVLQFTVEMLVVKNYLIAVFFITPMTILLSEAGNPAILNPDLLVTARLKDVLLGSLLGIIVGWVIYNEQLRYQVVKHIRVTKKILRK